jgi:hypothetical protein
VFSSTGLLPLDQPGVRCICRSGRRGSWQGTEEADFHHAGVADLSPGFPGDVAMETVQKGWFKLLNISVSYFQVTSLSFPSGGF